jgi:acetyl-CoA synthetase
MAAALFAFSRERLAPYKRIRRIAFRELPKTISGKIRRVELRREEAGREAGAADTVEYRAEDFPG